MPDDAAQLFELLILAIPVATVTWTVTHEEVFREVRNWCPYKSQKCRTIAQRKFFYIATCEFCFSFYVSIAMAGLMHFRLLYEGWGGYLVSVLSLVWVANCYMSLFSRLRLEIKKERVQVSEHEAAGGLVRKGGVE